MADPRQDPRAHDLLSADLGVVGALGGMLRSIATQAQSSAAGLRGAAGDASWTGTAADAFRSGVGKLPGDLDNVTRSYQEAADALTAYEGELSTLQPAFQSLVSQLGTASATLANAQTSLNGAQQSLSAASAKLTPAAFANPLAPLPSVPANSPLRAAVSSANTAVNNAQGEVDGLSARGFHILDEFQTARNTAKGHVDSAGHMPPHRSFWDSVFHDVGSFMGGALHFVEDIGVGIWNSVTGTVGAFENFVNHPSLESFGKLAADVAVDAGIVVLAASAPEALGLLGAEALAEGGAEVATEEGVSLAARVASMGEPAANVLKVAGYAGSADDLLQGHYANAALDAVFANVPSGDDIANDLGVGEEQAKAAEAASEAMKTYSAFTGYGFTPGEALSLMTDGEVASVLGNLTNLDDAGEIAAATQRTSSAAASAARTAARVGAPVAFAIDSATDHVHDLANEKLATILHGEPASACP